MYSSHLPQISERITQLKLCGSAKIYAFVLINESDEFLSVSQLMFAVFRDRRVKPQCDSRYTEYLFAA